MNRDQLAELFWKNSDEEWNDEGPKQLMDKNGFIDATKELIKTIEKQAKIIDKLKEQKELLKQEIEGMSSFTFIEYSRRQAEIEEIENEA